MYRQHRQTLSSIGTQFVKFSAMVDITGKISWQYLTAGFSSDGGTYG